MISDRVSRLRFRKDHFASNTSGGRSGQASAREESSTGQGPWDEESETLARPALVPFSSLSTECVSSSRCQIQATSARLSRLEGPRRALALTGSKDPQTDVLHRNCRQSAVGKPPGRACVNPPKTPGGARRDRTDDLMLAKHALSQLSYGPRQ